MEIERPRRTRSTPTTSELFICFTFRLSHSSSMRLSSKSVLSPGHSTADKSTAVSLSSSLSRRLRHNGSLRGGGAQSPAMFPSNNKKNNGSGFDNPEPSSPKVTCIGQVRVKTKKQGKKMKMRACRSKRLSGGEASFRRIEHGHDGLMHQNSQGIQNQQQPDCGLNHRNQRWVHLPLTICEALRAFGSEFSCFFPCKSSCFGSCGGGEREKGKEERESGNSCGAVFRWLVAVQEGRERDIELVVEEEEDERERRERMVVGMECSSRRRSIFDDMEFKDEIFDVQNEGKEDAEGARVSMCIPPKNALLLMRCRSDPAKMSALSHKIWEPPIAQDSDEEEEEEEEEERFVDEKTEEITEKREKLGEMSDGIDEICGDCVAVDANVEEHEVGSEEIEQERQDDGDDDDDDDEEEETEEKQSIENTEETLSIEENREKTEENQSIEELREENSVLVSGEEENQASRCSIDAITIRKMFEEGGNELEFSKNAKDERENIEISDLSSSSSSSSPSVDDSIRELWETQPEEEIDKEFVKSMEEDKEESPPLEGPQELTHAETLKEERENEPKWENEEREITKKVLPDCLLLMMCEPKLSMEVSNETWVCSTDFIRWLTERHHSKKPTKTDGPDEPKKKRKAPPTFPPPAAVQPARSSISFPAGGVEQKLVKAGGGYEPLVLTRCKSAPMRSMAKIAAPELACIMWGRGRENGRKMEPHRPATYGVGAAEVGF